MPAKGNAEWKGDLQSGIGTFTTGTGLTAEYSFTSRFEDAPGANPEQLVGTALASCFSMFLANVLAQAGHTAESVKTDALVHLRRIDDKPTIALIELTTVGVVPGLDEASFKEQAEAAKAACPVSRALGAVPEITLDASLAG